MKTECSGNLFEFHPLDRRKVWGRFDGGAITSDAGALLLREVEKRTGIIAQFAACFMDHRDPGRIEHSVRELVAQRVYGLILRHSTAQVLYGVIQGLHRVARLKPEFSAGFRTVAVPEKRGHFDLRVVERK